MPEPGLLQILLAGEGIFLGETRGTHQSGCSKLEAAVPPQLGAGVHVSDDGGWEAIVGLSTGRLPSDPTFSLSSVMASGTRCETAGPWISQKYGHAYLGSGSPRLITHGLL